MARRTIEALPANTADFAARVAERAYFKAKERGFAPGHELEDWLAAERELTVPAKPVLSDAAPPNTKKKSVARKKASTATVKKLN